jgi:alpha-ketoglutarate-dependent taurine dioxygenase
VLEGARPQRLQVEFNDTSALGADAQRALEELKRECARADTLIRIDLKPGQAAILNNNKVLHGRGPFT